MYVINNNEYKTHITSKSVYIMIFSKYKMDKCVFDEKK